MPDELDLSVLPALSRPTPDRPLAGLTVLVVEDSRFASEAVRLLALRSGARLRRADCLRAAERHLATYRPAVILVDPGLPDGSGIDLIARLNAADPRIDAIVAISGDERALAQAALAGADAGIAKPVTSLAAFQQTILAALPEAMRPDGPRRLPAEEVVPDRLALVEDLGRITELLESGEVGGERLDYAAQFLTGVARSAGDAVLETAALKLADSHAAGRPVVSDMARVAGLLQDRLHRRAVV
jgi:CheY-like chemotaxis protein